MLQGAQPIAQAYIIPGLDGEKQNFSSTIVLTELPVLFDSKGIRMTLGDERHLSRQVGTVSNYPNFAVLECVALLQERITS